MDLGIIAYRWLHLANQKSRQFYNGHTTEEIESSDIIGIHCMNQLYDIRPTTH